MDALALLCNLYGDGPATLKRLRVHGVLRIDDLGGKAAGEIATMLALSPAGARRFIKEAAALKKRVRVGEADAESAAEERAEPRESRSILRGKQAILEAAAQRWGELEAAPRAARRRESPPPPAAPAEEISATALDAAELDRATHAALADAGVTTLDELVGAEADALALESKLGISQVLFAQALARRKLREQGSQVALANRSHEKEELSVHFLPRPSRAEERFSPSERPAHEWLSEHSVGRADAISRSEDQAAGPFA